MFVFQASILLKPFSSHCVGRDNSHLHPSSVLPPQHLASTVTRGSFPCRVRDGHILKFLPCLAMSRKSDPKPDSEPTANPKAKSKSRRDSGKTEVLGEENDNDNRVFPQTIPRKPRRGRRSEAAAVEDFVRKSLNKTFETIQQQNSEIMEDKENILKEEKNDSESDEEEEEDEEEEDEEEESDSGSTKRKKKMLVEVEDPNWPLDADVGWGIRASEYFDKHPIKNVIGEDGVEIDWEGEIDDNWVQEINCLEWESFAYHPSPLIVLVFERYNRATDNWKTLKELEKAILVYWQAKDRLPPRSVKIDINIERDLAYALKVKECPQILFLRGNRILYREKEIRTADELVHMIAFFYYNAKKPSWIDDAALSRPF